MAVRLRVRGTNFVNKRNYGSYKGKKRVFITLDTLWQTR